MLLSVSCQNLAVNLINMKGTIKLLFIVYSFAADAFLFSGCNCGLGAGLFGGCADAQSSGQYYQYYYPYQQYAYQNYQQQTPAQVVYPQAAVAAAGTQTPAGGQAPSGGQAPAGAQTPAAQNAAQVPQAAAGPNEITAPVEAPVEQPAAAPEAGARSYGYENTYASKSNSLAQRQHQSRQYSAHNAPLYSERNAPLYSERNAPLYSEAALADRPNLPIQSGQSNYHFIERNAPLYSEAALPDRSNLPIQSGQSNYHFIERNPPLYSEAALAGKSNQNNIRSANWQRSALITILQEPETIHSTGPQRPSRQDLLNSQNLRPQVINPAATRVQVLKTLLSNAPLSQNLYYDSAINPRFSNLPKADLPYTNEYQFSDNRLSPINYDNRLSPINYENRLSPINYDYLAEDEITDNGEMYSPSMTSWDEEDDVSPVFYHDTKENKWYYL